MTRLQRSQRSSSETQIVDRILDEFQRHAEATGRAATTAHIPRSLEYTLDGYYLTLCDKTARQMVPTWKGIKTVVWDAREFKVG